jgi:hypothetical protein
MADGLVAGWQIFDPEKMKEGFRTLRAAGDQKTMTGNQRPEAS